jgi:NAD(P)-dependent dehydrogenase (short-subunit alcohol dehydrogenase family)
MPSEMATSGNGNVRGATEPDTPHALTGQVALVTGGGRGIGRAAAQALAAAGATVAVAARSGDQLEETVALIEGAGRRALAVPTDVTDRMAVARLVAAVEARLGPVDLLVNGAGAARVLGPLWETDPDAWWTEATVNLRGPLLCAHAVLPGMVARGRGRIVNLVSGAVYRPIPNFSAYVVSKTALARLTENLARETAAHGVAVFALIPGTVRTAMSEHLLESPEGRRWLGWFREAFDAGRDVPMARPIELLLTLASGRADALSGRVLSVHDDLRAALRQTEVVERDQLYALRVRSLR